MNSLLSESDKIPLEKIIVASHYGFCMGVKRAISITEKTMLEENRVTILNEIVHNNAIVQKFAKKGVGQSKSIDNIQGGTVIISAHGASPEIYRKAEQRGLKIIDATCPLVIHIHKIIRKLASSGYHILHFGDPDHDETIGIVGYAPDRVQVIRNVEELKSLPVFQGRLALTSQTTARASDFEKIEQVTREKYPDIEIYNTICDATGRRQAAITELAPQVDMILVVGSNSSANSKRLVQISKSMCDLAFLIDSADDIKREWFKIPGRPVKVVGLSAGASTPGFLIEGVVNKLKDMAGGEVVVVRPNCETIINKLALDN